MEAVNGGNDQQFRPIYRNTSVRDRCWQVSATYKSEIFTTSPISVFATLQDNKTIRFSTIDSVICFKLNRIYQNVW